jgi:hypothetical protein
MSPTRRAAPDKSSPTPSIVEHAPIANKEAIKITGKKRIISPYHTTRHLAAKQSSRRTLELFQDSEDL